MQLGVDHAYHELGHRARRVELACVAGALQVAQQLLVHVAERMALLRLVEVHTTLDLVEHLADQLPRLHVVVGVLEHIAHDKAQRLAMARRQIAQLGKQVDIDEVLQLIAGDPFRIGCPVAPTQPLRQRRPVVLVDELPFLLTVIEDLEEQHPHQLTDALGVSVDAGVLAHDVLDGFDGAADRHRVTC